jgi:hypothetical protein
LLSVGTNGRASENVVDFSVLEEVVRTFRPWTDVVVEGKKVE